MNITETKIPGLLIIEPKVFGDERGFFMESYNKDRYQEAGVAVEFVQDNLSQSKKGVLRGLHYQAPPFAQGKLVTVIKGAVLDVAVDIRQGSPTYGQYEMVELTAENKKQFWIPAGFAHGFVTLEDDTLFAYKCTNVYSPEHDRGVKWDDAAIGIEWSCLQQGSMAGGPDLGIEFTVSEKDQNQPLLKDIKQEFTYQE
jgi:dTDP-4-dehydrorhamnose 3,5-epimerase